MLNQGMVQYISLFSLTISLDFGYVSLLSHHCETLDSFKNFVLKHENKRETRVLAHSKQIEGDNICIISSRHFVRKNE